MLRCGFVYAGNEGEMTGFMGILAIPLMIRDYEAHWFPLIRPYQALISWGGGVALGGGTLGSHDGWKCGMNGWKWVDFIPGTLNILFFDWLVINWVIKSNLYMGNGGKSQFPSIHSLENGWISGFRVVFLGKPGVI